jgi:hypothetical protein
MENVWMMYKSFDKDDWALDTLDALEDSGFGVIKRGKNEVEYFRNRSGLYDSTDSTYVKKWLLGAGSQGLDPDQHRVLRRKLIPMGGRSLENVMDNLPTYNPQSNPLPVLKDTKDQIIIPFRNGVVVITADEISLKKYSEVVSDGNGVWKDKVIDRDIEIRPSEIKDGGFKAPLAFQCEGIYSDFVRKVMIRDGDSESVSYVKSLRAVESCLGYLMHGYNNPAVSKFIYLTDWSVSDGNSPNGGNGKSLIFQSLMYLKDRVPKSPNGKGAFSFIDGKTWQSEGSASRFNITSSAVNEKTDVFFIDDAPDDWDAKAIFTHVTGDFTTESKGQTAIVIPSEVKPKIVVSSNYPPVGSGNSYERRRMILHAGNYFKTKQQEGIEEPIVDEYGKLLYDEFDDKDWSDFYNYCFLCGQRYLKYGLKPQPLDRLKTEMGHKSVSIQVGTNVAQWLSNHLKTQKSRFEEVPGYSQDDLYNDYKKDFPNDSEMTPTELHKHLRSIVEESDDYEYNPHRAHKGDTFQKRRYLVKVLQEDGKKKGVPHIVIGY